MIGQGGFRPIVQNLLILVLFLVYGTNTCNILMHIADSNTGTRRF